MLGLANTSNLLLIGYETKRELNFTLPQGWGFFTKDPREVIVDAYVVNKGGLKLLTNNNTSWNNNLGLSRRNRFVGFELSLLLGHVPREAWKSRIGELRTDGVDSVYKVKTVQSKLINFIPGETYLLHQYKPIPAKWAGSNQEEYRPYLSALIKLSE